MLKINNVIKSFASGTEPILNGVNLSLNKGEFCILIGANGSGKSTLLKIIYKELFPDSGSVFLKGKVTQVVQDINKGTISTMTLFENIVLSEILCHKAKFSFYRRYIDGIIKKIRELGIGLEAYVHKPLHSLSGGQRQIIATLMAINSGRQILLLDEHTSALDPKMQNLLMEYTVRQAVNLNLTTIMITHKMDDAIKYGDRIIMLHKGKIVLDISGNDKKNLKAQDLITMFHRYEDQNLLSIT